MSREDIELEGWKREWQALGGRDGLAGELANRVMKDGRRLRRHAAVEVASAAVSTVLSLWLLVRTHGELTVMVACGGVLIFNGIWLTRMATLRRGTLRAAGAGLDAFLELTRRRLADDLRWNAFERRSLPLIAAFVVPWQIWAFVSHYDHYAAEPWEAVVGFGGAAAILIGVFVYQRRKRRSLEAARDAFERLVADRTLV